MIVRKKQGKTVKAYELGAGTEMERQLIAAGKIIKHEDGTYELFSQETREHGAQAETGDFFKVDGSGFPYPNARTWFDARHQRTEEADTFIQIPEPLQAWTVNEPMCEEITWLLEQGKLTISEDTPEEYFSAMLWGARHRSPKDSVVVFYSVERDADNHITDIEFNFVAKKEFDATYDIIEI